MKAKRQPTRAFLDWRDHCHRQPVPFAAFWREYRHDYARSLRKDVRLTTTGVERIALDPDTADFLLGREFGAHLRRCADCGRGAFTDAGQCLDCAARQHELEAA